MMTISTAYLRFKQKGFTILDSRTFRSPDNKFEAHLICKLTNSINGSGRIEVKVRAVEDIEAGLIRPENVLHFRGVNPAILYMLGKTIKASSIVY